MKFQDGATRRYGMAETATATNADTDTPAWHKSIRALFHTAWNARDGAQLALYREYQQTGDKRLADFRRSFERATQTLITLTLNELYPLTDEDDPDEDPQELAPGRRD
jgi:hypothetical protein